MIRFWNKRGLQTKNYKGFEHYTSTEIPFYIYRRNRILKLLKNLNGKRILDLGCANGINTIYLKKKGANVVGVDISENLIKLAKKNALNEKLNIPFFKIDGENLPFEDKSFDIVLTMFVLQHILDKKSLNRLYKEIHRVLDDKGEMINFERVSVPKTSGPTWVIRETDEYVKLASFNNFNLIDNYVISSRFWDDMMIPYYFFKKRLYLSNNNKFELFYSKLAVFLTKQFDKVWKTDKYGTGYYIFRKCRKKIIN